MKPLLEAPPALPLDLYHAWYAEAVQAEPNDPNAAALATASGEGLPSVRMVLVKRADERGFWFFTNERSEKGRQLAENPRAALCLHWKSLRRQVRVSGPVTDLSADESDAYFHSRSRGSQIGAAVSQQSRALDARATMETAVHRFADAHPGEIPRPAWWHGYAIALERIEFWADGPDRLHDRIVYTRNGQGWRWERLWP